MGIESEDWSDDQCRGVLWTIHWTPHKLRQNNNRQQHQVVPPKCPFPATEGGRLGEETRWPDHTLWSRPWGGRLEHSDAILIGDSACQGLQACSGFVSQRKSCQQLRETGRMSPWPCLSAGGGEECWGKETPSPTDTQINTLPVYGKPAGTHPEIKTDTMTQWLRGTGGMWSPWLYK